MWKERKERRIKYVVLRSRGTNETLQGQWQCKLVVRIENEIVRTLFLLFFGSFIILSSRWRDCLTFLLRPFYRSFSFDGVYSDERASIWGFCDRRCHRVRFTLVSSGHPKLSFIRPKTLSRHRPTRNGFVSSQIFKCEIGIPRGLTWSSDRSVVMRYHFNLQSSHIP